MKFIMALAACYVLVLTVVVVVCIFLIAAMLRLIQMLDLDPAKILHNVDVIFDTVDAIIERVFSPRKDREGKSNRGLLLKIVAWVNEGLAKVIEAALAAASLFFTLIAVGLILAIAGLLRLLQIIELNPEKIMENVDMIFDTCDAIINRIFSPRKDNGEKSKRGILVTIISWIDEGIAKIVEAALGVIYLFLMLVGIGLILAMAGLLRVIQEIDLDPDKIIENVNMVFDTCDMIVNRIFSPRKEEADKSNRGILVTIISWIDEGLAKIVEAALGIIYLFLMMVCVGLVLSIAGLLRLIQEIDLNWDIISEKVACVFDTADMVIERIMSPRSEEGEGSSRGILLTIMGWIFGEGLVKIFEAAMSIIYLFLIMICIGLVLGIAKLLVDIQEIDLDFKKIEKVVDDVFKTANHIIEKVFEEKSDDEDKAGSWLGTLIGFFAPDLGKIIDAILAIINLALIFMAVSLVRSIANAIAEMCALPDLKDATAKVDQVFKAAQHIVNKVFNNDLSMPEVKGDKKWWWMFVPLPNEVLMYMEKMKGLNAVNTALGLVAKIAQNIQLTYEACKDIDLDAAKTMVDKVLGVAELVADRVFNNGMSFKFLEPKQEDIDFAKGLMGRFGSTLWGAELARDHAKAKAYEEAMLKVQALTMCSTVLAAVKDMAENIAALEKVKIPENLTGVSEKIDKVLRLAGEITQKLFSAEFKITLPELTEEQLAAIKAANTTVKEESKLLGLSKSKTTSFDSKGYQEDVYNARLQQLEMRVQIISMTAAVVQTLIGMANNIVEMSQMKLPSTEPVLSLIDSLLKFGSDIYKKLFSEDIMKGFGIETTTSKTLGITTTTSNLKSQNEKITGMAGIVMSIFDMVGTIVDRYLEMIDKINKVNVTQDAESKITGIFDVAVMATEKIGELSDNTKLSISKIKRINDVVGSALDMISTTKDKLISLGKVNFSDDNSLPITRMVRCSMSCLKIISDAKIDPRKVSQSLDLIDRTNESMKQVVKVGDKDVRNTKAITENYIKFFEKVDSMDLQKLQHTDWLMRSWASLSKDLRGDFNGLAEAINQHIMPMLETLNSTMDNVNKCQKEIIAELTKPVDINGTGTENNIPGDTTNNTQQGNAGDPPPGGPPQTTVNEPANTGKELSSAQGKKERTRISDSKTEPKTGKKYTVTFATIKEA